MTYDERIEMLRLADDLASGETNELDTHEMSIVISALRLAADRATLTSGQRHD